MVLVENNDFYIAQCKTLIEQKLAWGNSEQWQNQDFETLSEKIFEETKIQLSITTLKRIWGKVRYDSTPNLATLNALVQFIGYENWRIFISAHLHKENPPPQETTINEVVIKQEEATKIRTVIPKLLSRQLFKKTWIIAGGVIFLGILIVFLSFQKKVKLLTYSNVVFKSKPVTLGLPNTVVFQYDASNSNADSVFIQQSWDSQRRFKVAKEQKEYTSTYYYPGYFRAKLILNDSIVKEHDVFIETDGWLGTIDKDSIPIYFSKSEVQQGELMGISAKDFSLQNIDLQGNIFWTSLFNVNRNNVAPSDNFTFEIEVKNTFNQGNGVCQHTRIVLLCTEGVHVIPLSIKGCVGELNLVLGNENIEGKTKDLSAFGVNFSDWVRVRCEVKNRHAQIFLNDKLAYEGDFQYSIGQIIGTKIRFAGTGQVRNFQIKEGNYPQN